MLPEIRLRNVSRDDVDRIAWWLGDTEVSSRWFGHYGCGDPVHRGYDPHHMLEAGESEWERVFSDPHRLIYSVYTEGDEHVGECQAVLDGEGGAELALLIGRKDLWHRGYGTSTVITLMDRMFGPFGLDRVWVNVPDDRTTALGLFENLGFTLEASRGLCERPDGSTLNASILAMDRGSYRSTRRGEGRALGAKSVVTINGLPGSGSELVGAEVARMMPGRFVDHEIARMLSERLRCSQGELEALVASQRSVWTRMLSSVALPMEWSAAYDAGYHWFRPVAGLDYDVPEGHVTKKRYLQELAGVVGRLSLEGNVVLHSHGSHLFVPSNVTVLNVFVSASQALRQQRTASEQGLSSDETGRLLKRTEREVLSVSKSLFGADLTDMELYGLTLNMDRLSPRTAAEIVVGALHIAAPSLRSEAERQTPQAAPVA